jgi:carbon-monoxide dehydrogenase large subunit
MMKYSVGQSVPRSEDPRLLKGYGNFIDDVNLPFQAHAFMLRAPHAHADILSINTSDAENAPGVVAVLTGVEYEADGMGVISGPTPRKRRDGSAMFRPMRPALSRDRVRHVGQIVAVVIADSVDFAKDAAELINVDYTPCP